MTFTKSNTAKVAAGFVGFALAFAFVVAPAPAKAQSMTELQAMIAALQAQIAALSGGSSTSHSHTFTTDLTVGSTGAEVVALQQFLVSKGFLTMPAGVSMGTFGSMTQSAVAAYQSSKGIMPASGYFGPATRASVNSMMVVVPPTTGNNNSNNNGGLQGGAGSIEDADFISSLNNEEVGEDEEDVEVAGLELDVDDGSDIQITAVRLIFDEGTGATGDFEDYASEVSIMLDGEEFARVDADSFNEDNDWSRTVSLDNGAVIDADSTGDLTVALSGVSNLDSSDSGDEWDVAFGSVRFVDAQGASVTDTSTGDIDSAGTANRTFSFESFAAASDAELKISKGDDEVNDAHVIDVDDSDDTNEVSVLSANFEAEGDSDLVIDEVPVNFDVTGATHVDDVISTVTLFADGEEIGSENLGTDVGTDETVTFDDLDYTVEAGSEVEFVVKADFNSTSTSIATISAQISATERGNIDVEDESGEDLVSGDRTGTAVGEAHATLDSGIMVELVEVNTDKTFTADNAGEKDQVTFEFVFNVTAFDGDAYIDREVTTAPSPDTSTDGHAFASTSAATTGTTTVSKVITSNTTDSSDVSGSTGAFFVEEDDTREFTLTAVLEAGIDGVMQVSLTGIKWDDDSTDPETNLYNFNLTDYISDLISVQII